MKNIVLASLAALAFATPAAAADFSGPRVGAVIGLADDDFAGSEAFTYGVNAGYDFDLGSTVAGITVEYQDTSEDGLRRDLSAVGRYGFKAGDAALVYGLAGYTNLGVEALGFETELDGVRVGGGVEYALTDQVYANVEYRYSNYEADLDTHQFAAGLGFRF
jgi:outer membrane immunogenic protein